MTINDDQRSVLEDVAHGADVYGRYEAETCRELERLKLVRIVKARTSPPGYERQPYFGAKATAKGMRLLEATDVA